MRNVREGTSQALGIPLAMAAEPISATKSVVKGKNQIVTYVSLLSDRVAKLKKALFPTDTS